MTRFAIAAALALAVTLPTVSAQAQSPRTFVSAAGSDSNPCSFAAPCRHFQAAVNVTSPGGEVDALDPAGYGPITISQAVTIEGQGWSYIAPPAGGTGITINAVSGNVSIHGVSLNGAGITGPTNGIVFNSGGSLSVEDCVIRNMTNQGLDFTSTATTGTQTLAVSNSYFNDNGFGMVIESKNQGVIKAAIDRTGFSGNVSDGLDVQGLNGTGAVSVAVTDSVAANNNFGFVVLSTTGHSVTNLSLTHSVAAGNLTGVYASATIAVLWLAQSTLTGNGHGYDVETLGTINSYGDNYIDTSNGSPIGSLTSVAKQ